MHTHLGKDAFDEKRIQEIKENPSILRIGTKEDTTQAISAMLFGAS